MSIADINIIIPWTAGIWRGVLLESWLCGWRWLESSAPEAAEPEPYISVLISQRWSPVNTNSKVTVTLFLRLLVYLRQHPYTLLTMHQAFILSHMFRHRLKTHWSRLTLHENPNLFLAYWQSNPSLHQSWITLQLFMSIHAWAILTHLVLYYNTCYQSISDFQT